MAKTPHNTAVIFSENTLTYGELNERANRLARVFRCRGAGSDVIIGIIIDRSIEMLVGLLGILKAGAAYMPISPEYPEDRILYMLKDSGTDIRNH
ncbi:MAG: Tyrocidine synthase 3 [Firmicutes bacterium ADurb.Bin419]|nr:MAG: Tyrocidine synthase 3 [Firmicutes bacterium ADurb.Bin419]